MIDLVQVTDFKKPRGVAERICYAAGKCVCCSYLVLEGTAFFGEGLIRSRRVVHRGVLSCWERGALLGAGLPVDCFPLEEITFGSRGDPINLKVDYSRRRAHSCVEVGAFQRSSCRICGSGLILSAFSAYLCDLCVRLNSAHT